MVGVFSQYRERIKVRTEGWLLVSEQLVKELTALTTKANCIHRAASSGN
jgi:hypothetical protein